MKHIKEYEEFLNEGTINADEAALDKKLQTALLQNFKNVSYQRDGKDRLYYDYGVGLIHHYNEYETDDDWSWANPKTAKILQNCKFKPLDIKARVVYSEIISNAAPKEAHGYIGVSGGSYINNLVSFDLSNPKKANIAKEVKEFIKKSQKSPINDDMLYALLWNWQPSKAEYKQIDSRDQGIGRHASTHITKSYDKAFIIKDLNVALGKTEQETENEIRNCSRFKRDRLDFDWKQGVMIVGGTYTEVWD